MSAKNEGILFAEFKGNPPADAGLIRQVESEAALRLPEDYATWLQKMDGGQGFIGNAYLILWRVGELIKMNKAYAAAEFAPGLFLFGSDGGGEAFAFDTRSDANPIVSVPFIGMELKAVLFLAANFTAFLEELFEN